MTDFKKYGVDNAIILAAGSGTRLAPLTYETPKGLIKVKGKPMIERQIEQLLEVGITEIFVVIGYLKEQFAYLVEKYGVHLVENPEFAVKNNFVSLYYAREHLKNTYLLMADNWIEDNLFHTHEPHSWFSGIYFDHPCAEWEAVLDADDRIIRLESSLATPGWTIVGPAFLSEEFSFSLRPLLEDYYQRPSADDYYWEHLILENPQAFEWFINRAGNDNVHEFETFAELCAYDPSHLVETTNPSLQTIATVFSAPIGAITAIEPLKVGMTNLSFLFTLGGQTYVFRQPGPGTEKLIDRQQEKRAYELLESLDLTDEVCYFDGVSGQKIAPFYPDARISDPENDEDLRQGMRALKRLHDAAIPAPGRFEVATKTDFYEGLLLELAPVPFADYEATKQKMRRLVAWRDRLAVPEVLCHGDFAHVNVLHLDDGKVRIIDWEYSGGGDPIMDISCYSIFAYFSRERLDLALRFYLDREPTREETGRLYLYAALCGFLWSIWGEYKQACGSDFGDYTQIQHRYATDYYTLLEELGYLAEVEGEK
ncbi:MAG: phosphotransferase [Propionibacteriaceae bacterium]|jgi:CTP:phosphocholine cytidylyltransferase-like protein/thiamine kinase-like enzyme|nr:phosphotransferase [Propionibacteriaceae bacterium]